MGTETNIRTKSNGKVQTHDQGRDVRPISEIRKIAPRGSGEDMRDSNKETEHVYLIDLMDIQQ